MKNLLLSLLITCTCFTQTLPASQDRKETSEKVAGFQLISPEWYQVHQPRKYLELEIKHHVSLEPAAKYSTGRTSDGQLLSCEFTLKPKPGQQVVHQKKVVTAVDVAVYTLTETPQETYYLIETCTHLRANNGSKTVIEDSRSGILKNTKIDGSQTPSLHREGQNCVCVCFEQRG